VNGAAFDVTRTFAGEFLHFNLTNNVQLKADTAYGVFVSFEAVVSGFRLDDVRDQLNNPTGNTVAGESYPLGGLIRVQGATQDVGSNGDDLVFYVDAYAPEPASTALFGLGAFTLLTKRRRRRA
jgi:hypothetical protein